MGYRKTVEDELKEAAREQVLIIWEKWVEEETEGQGEEAMTEEWKMK